MNLFYFLLRSFLSFMSVFTMLLHSLVGVCSRYIAISPYRHVGRAASERKSEEAMKGICSAVVVDDPLLKQKYVVGLVRR